MIQKGPRERLFDRHKRDESDMQSHNNINHFKLFYLLLIDKEPLEVMEQNCWGIWFVCVTIQWKSGNMMKSYTLLS